MKQKYEALIQYVHEGKSLRRIAKELGIHRETVSKYVREYEQRRADLVKGAFLYISKFAV